MQNGPSAVGPCRAMSIWVSVEHRMQGASTRPLLPWILLLAHETPSTPSCYIPIFCTGKGTSHSHCQAQLSCEQREHTAPFPFCLFLLSQTSQTPCFLWLSSRSMQFPQARGHSDPCPEPGWGISPLPAIAACFYTSKALHLEVFSTDSLANSETGL